MHSAYMYAHLYAHIEVHVDVCVDTRVNRCPNMHVRVWVFAHYLMYLYMCVFMHSHRSVSLCVCDTLVFSKPAAQQPRLATATLGKAL